MPFSWRSASASISASRSITQRFRSKWVTPRLACWSRRRGFSSSGLEFLADSEKIASARAELRREHADAGAASDLVDCVEQIDDIEANRQRLAVGRGECVRDTGIELRIGRQVVDIGIALAEARAVYHVGGEFCAAPVPHAFVG